ncbi:EamA family transporter [Oceanimonas sp. CHS3-5]|uniref:EamA family transporter n=1 Tax=Oceanimonas sp. CHS3-5 TaxID=3068186 RepID=UPI003531C0B0
MAPYALWYWVLPELTAGTAATVQLSVPIIAAAGGVLFLGEPFSTRLAIASVIVVGGIFVFIHSDRRAAGQ